MASSKREKELARQRAERQAARRAAAAARRKQRSLVLAAAAAVAVVAVAVVALGLALRGGDEDTLTPAAQAAGPSAAPSLAPGECAFAPAERPASKQAPRPPTTAVEAKAFTATLSTNRGDVVIDLDGVKAPCTVNSLRSLAQAKYFDGTSCHRLTTGGLKVLQCGDPTGTGSGGPGYQFADENLEGATYPRGTVAMANAGPGTNGSQFFLVYGDSQLPPAYTPFGRITKGLEVLDTVAKAGAEGTSGDGKPKTPVQITSLRVTPGA